MQVCSTVSPCSFGRIEILVRCSLFYFLFFILYSVFEIAEVESAIHTTQAIDHNMMVGKKTADIKVISEMTVFPAVCMSHDSPQLCYSSKELFDWHSEL